MQTTRPCISTGVREPRKSTGDRSGVYVDLPDIALPVESLELNRSACAGAYRITQSLVRDLVDIIAVAWTRALDQQGELEHCRGERRRLNLEPLGIRCACGKDSVGGRLGVRPERIHYAWPIWVEQGRVVVRIQ